MTTNLRISNEVKSLIPHIFFVIFFCFMVINNPHPNGLFGLILTLPFLIQIFFPKRWLNDVLAFLTLLFSLYCIVGFFTQISKGVGDGIMLERLLLSAVFVLLSLAMSIWLVIQASRTDAGVKIQRA
ncbi:MAG TPA: hypothetical protein PK339_16805 [Flavitalea sp.]|nr:hypothetical protein [Flavitalea sp.]